MQQFYGKINETVASGFDWMSRSARVKSLKLLSNIKVDYGVNTLITSEEKLNSYYHDLTLDSKSFFANLISIDRFRLLASRREVDQLTNNIKGDDYSWRSSGSVSGASVRYNFNANTLRLESAVLQQPFFDEYLPDVVNMAAIGTKVMNALNLPLILRRAKGRRKDWWNLRDQAHFNTYEQCLLDSFRGHEVYLSNYFQYKTSDQQFGTYPRGSVKLNPDVARKYLVSHHVAFMLAESFMIENANKNNKLIPSVGVMSANQLFYLAYAQANCQSMDATMAVMMNAVMKLFPHHHMINNFMYNSPHFLQTFGCQIRDQTSSTRNCHL